MLSFLPFGFSVLRLFSSLKHFNWFWGPRSSFPWIKQPGCEVNHSLPSSAEVKNELYLCFPVYDFLAWTGKLTFTFLFIDSLYIGITN
jgi:hypothetical protein